MDFRITARNATPAASEEHLAQACIQLGGFTGVTTEGRAAGDYLPECFISFDGKRTRLHEVRPWAREARHVPDQVWCPKPVPRSDVNPRPPSPPAPGNRLIGCFSADDALVFAMAFEPYQDLFQGVIRCLHSDLRFGGLKPGETRQVRGKIHLARNDIPALPARYARDFSDHRLREPCVPHSSA